MPVSRRKFIAGAAATVASASLANVQPVYAKENSGLRIAVIGVKGRGMSHVESIHENLVAICDVDETVLHQRASDIKKGWNRSVETFNDYRKLLERKDIDAVSIATPNHTHALITIAAAQAGKDVYVEKPVSHNIWEGRQMVAAAQKYGRIIQCGTQSRSSRSLQAGRRLRCGVALGCDSICFGYLLQATTKYWQTCDTAEDPGHDRLRPVVWTRRESRSLSSAAPLRLALGLQHRQRRHGQSGDPSNGHLPAGSWAKQTLAPRVISIGGRLGYDDAGDTPNTQVVYHDYEAAPLIFETRGLPRSKEAQANWRESMDRLPGLADRRDRAVRRGPCAGAKLPRSDCLRSDRKNRENVAGWRKSSSRELATGYCRRDASLADGSYPGRSSLEFAVPRGRYLTSIG